MISLLLPFPHVTASLPSFLHSPVSSFCFALHLSDSFSQGVGEYMHLGGTLDNALGEVYDKVARELDLLYAQEGVPGGEAVELLAR